MTDVLDAFRQIARYAVEDGCSAATLTRIVQQEWRKARCSTTALWTHDMAVEAVDSFTERRGFPPACRDAGHANELPSVSTAIRLFGSWNGLLAAAGLPTTTQARRAA